MAEFDFKNLGIFCPTVDHAIRGIENSFKKFNATFDINNPEHQGKTPNVIYFLPKEGSQEFIAELNRRLAFSPVEVHSTEIVAVNVLLMYGTHFHKPTDQNDIMKGIEINGLQKDK